MPTLLAQIAGDSVDWADQTSIHPVGLAVLLGLTALVFVLPRAWALAPLLILACFVQAGQRIVILTLDFSFLRILVIAYWLRILAFQDFRGVRPLKLDYAVAAWILVGSIVYIIQQGSVSAITNRLGHSYEALGLYIAFRCLLRHWSDIDRTVATLALLAIPVSILFAVEQATGRNMFSVMGGVREFTLERQGRMRAQGAFSHPIMAGCFWAIVLVLVAGMVMARRRLSLMAAGTIGAFFILVACASSTPLLAFFAGMLGLGLAFVRPLLPAIRWGVVLMLIVLHLVMQAPVWHLIARVSAVGGSTGWHRYHLIDNAITRFPEWALFGTRSTAHWGWGLEDVTNQYILEGVRGGAITLALFVMVIVFAFRAVGSALAQMPTRDARFWITWALVGPPYLPSCGSACLGQMYANPQSGATQRPPSNPTAPRDLAPRSRTTPRLSPPNRSSLNTSGLRRGRAPTSSDGSFLR